MHGYPTTPNGLFAPPMLSKLCFGAPKTIEDERMRENHVSTYVQSKNRFLSQNFPFGGHRLARNTNLCGLGLIDFAVSQHCSVFLLLLLSTTKHKMSEKNTNAEAFTKECNEKEDTESTTSEPNVCG